MLAFLVLKCFALHAHRVDEGIYFYDAARLSEGARLYRDLFFAHPPLQLALPTLLAALPGITPIVLKAIPQLAGAAQGVLAYFVARRAFRSDLAGAVAALVLLFSEDFLKGSSFFTGINVADALLFGGLLLTLHRRAIAGGLLAGASVMTLLQTAPVALAIGLAAVAHDRRLGKRFAIGALGLVAAVHVVVLIYAGGAFLEQVYFYHLHKVGGADGGVLATLVVENLILFGGGATALVLGQTGSEPRPEARRLLAVAAAAVLLQLVAMGSRPTVFPFYFQPAFLPLAVAVGWAVSRGVERIRAARAPRDRFVGAALVLALLVPRALAGPIADVFAPRRARDRRTYSQTYQWKDAPLIGPLNRAVRALAWSGGVREADSFHASVTEYLWNQSRGFDSLAEIVLAVREATPSGGATLFGDSAATPLVAMASGRRILADFVDTNVQRFTSGTTTADETVAALEARGGPTLILASGNSGLFSLPAFRRYRDERYVPLRDFADGDGTRYTLYRRR